jgi:hypothetical protein
MRINLAIILIFLYLSACTPVSEINGLETELTPIGASESPSATSSPVPQATFTEEPAPTRQTTLQATVDASPTPEASPTVPAQPSPTLTVAASPTATAEALSAAGSSPSTAIIVDHRSVELFEEIPDEYLAAARELRMVFADRSVGVNINEGLDCLTATSWHQARAYCRNDYTDTSGTTWMNRTFTLDDYQAGAVPSRILFEPDPVKYDRSNWDYAIVDGSWEEVVASFINDIVPEYIDSKDVLSYQFNYFHIGQGTNIASPDDGFFVDLPREGHYTNRERWDISDFEALEEQYPDKIFFHWTTSLSRSTGSAEGEAFNDQMREYALTNNKILFDVADILSHDENGQPCYDNRDGVEYCNNNRCENHPDDGEDLLAICQYYTTETDGGHLGSVSGGRVRVAKAFWVLMAKIAGWEG